MCGGSTTWIKQEEWNIVMTMPQKAPSEQFHSWVIHECLRKRSLSIQLLFAKGWQGVKCFQNLSKVIVEAACPMVEKGEVSCGLGMKPLFLQISPSTSQERSEYLLGSA